MEKRFSVFEMFFLLVRVPDYCCCRRSTLLMPDDVVEAEMKIFVNVSLDRKNKFVPSEVAEFALVNRKLDLSTNVKHQQKIVQ